MGRASTLNPQLWTLNPQSAAVASAVAAAVAAAAAANTMTGREFEDEYDPARPDPRDSGFGLRVAGCGLRVSNIYLPTPRVPRWPRRWLRRWLLQRRRR